MRAHSSQAHQSDQQHRALHGSRCAALYQLLHRQLLLYHLGPIISVSCDTLRAVQAPV